ncbi:MULTISPECIES: hypothetical protein [unclassified Streptomyces]|nr:MULTISPECIES: hypothetical protein [unclassified Streptomyces]MDA5284440.1 hypothetical protein [Streptomyces sp. Isolate_45]
MDQQPRHGRPRTSRMKVALALAGAALSGAVRAVTSYLLDKFND